jgi:toxin ParE1/3/4
MNLAVYKSAAFLADYEMQFAWYVLEAGATVAWQFENSLNSVIEILARQPLIGRRRNFIHPHLQGLRSIPLASPFGQLLIFYRVNDAGLEVVRLMHGARDLPRRLGESPQVK